MAEPIAGFVDTNVFIHANASDPLTAECRAFLEALERGALHAWLEPVVLHELSYALPRLLQQLSRSDAADYLLLILNWPGIHGEIDLMRDAVSRWARTPGLSFVDAHLAALAAHRSYPVLSKNVREFVAQGIDVPDPLPSAPSR